jgi:hypothetical protein
MTKPLIGMMNNYDGISDHCGTQNRADRLLVSDLESKDQYGNQLFLILGVVDSENSTIGERFTCEACGNIKWYLRLYESVDVTEALQRVKVTS